MFQTVIEMEEIREPAQRKWTFSALQNIILLSCKVRKLEKLGPNISMLLKCTTTISKNISTEAIFLIIEELIKTDQAEAAQAQAHLATMLSYLKQNRSLEQLWMSANLKLCRIYLSKSQFQNILPILAELKSSCLLSDGSYDPKKQSTLLEIYCQEIQIYISTK